MLFDAHWHAFRVFGGVPERGIYDSETVFAIGSRTMVERARRWIGSAVARSGRSTCAFSP
jgi:transposase